MRLSSRVYPILGFRPGRGTGIQRFIGREQPFTVWSNFQVVRFCATTDEAYAALQLVLDEEFDSE